MMRSDPPVYRPSECGRFICETVDHLSVIRLHSMEDAAALQATHEQHWHEATVAGNKAWATKYMRRASELKQACAYVAARTGNTDVLRAARAA